MNINKPILNNIENVTEIYERTMVELINLYNPSSPLQLITLQLQNFYTNLNKQVRFKFISDFWNYIKEQQGVIVDDIQNENISFEEIERHIRKDVNNDYTVNFMIVGFLEKLTQFHSQKIREQIIDFVLQLLLNLHKMTAMNYICGSGGGIVLYRASLLKDMDYFQKVTPDVIFSFSDNIKANKKTQTV